MPIKFFDLLQDTWNFIRNRPTFTLYGVLLLAVLQVIISLSVPSVEINPQQPVVNQNVVEQLTAGLAPMILSALAVMFVNILLILNIKSINNGHYQHFFQNIGVSATRFFPAILLTLLQILPISLSTSFTLLQGGEASIIALPLMITGIYIFIKLNLVVYTYLIEEPQKSLGQSLAFNWAMSRGKMFPMVLFCLLAYLMPKFVVDAFSSLAMTLGKEFGTIVVQFVSAFVNFVVVIFSFRFYQIYRK